MSQGNPDEEEEEEDVDGDLVDREEAERGDDDQEETTETIIDIGGTEMGDESGYSLDADNKLQLLFLCPDDFCRLR
jgi:hypothetical protein